MEIKHVDIIFLLGYLFFGNYNDNTLYSCVFKRFKLSHNLAEIGPQKNLACVNLKVFFSGLLPSLVLFVSVWDNYSDIRIYLNIFRQIYSFV